MKLSVSRVASIRGEFRPPSDKSLTHRAYMLGAIASGPSMIRNPLRGEDCESTLRSLEQLGLRAEVEPRETLLIPAKEWKQPVAPLDCGNSGTTMRLLSGLVASRPLITRLVGDESLSRRPMKRISEPLGMMGAEVKGETPPLEIHGGELRGIAYRTPVASAQVKSCVLLAGLRASGETSVIEPVGTRDHTERMLASAGVALQREGQKVSLAGGQRPARFEFSVPGDISSAAFFMVASAMLPDSEVVATEVGANPFRTGILEIFADAGVPFWLDHRKEELGEPVQSVRVRSSETLRSFRIEGEVVPRLIDEIPVLAVLATQCEGTTEIRDAKELRVKESDRIELMADGLRRMGAYVETFPDGMAITGPAKLKGINVDARGDHRIAMAFAVAGLVAEGTTEIEGADTIRTSFPDFEQELWRLCIV